MMKEKSVNIVFQYLQVEELSAEDQSLIEMAIKATNNSYAKYSNFHVGSAVLLANGQIVTGANQENAAYPSGLCSERIAVFSAQAQYPDQPILKLAIAARNQKGLLERTLSPCGACRQVLLEVEHRYRQPMRILLYGTSEICCVSSAKDLMPLAFVEESML